jgi:hypothetical protein
VVSRNPHVTFMRHFVLDHASGNFFSPICSMPLSSAPINPSILASMSLSASESSVWDKPDLAAPTQTIQSGHFYTNSPGIPRTTVSKPEDHDQGFL